MRQLIKNFLCIGLLASGLQTSWAFSLGGPINNGGDNWQSPVIGYGLPGDLNAPKNLGEEYRRNTSVMYYTFNANFFDFYGSNGVVAIEQAFAIMNESLTNVNSYSDALTEFPLNSQAVNYQAAALGLSDLKSVTLSALMEQMGLADPVRYAWTLHDRFLPSGAQCPNYIYMVVQRNFDITTTPLNQSLYSPYVNGTLWTYVILEACPATPPDPQALAFPVQVDPLADSFTAVASGGLLTGGYYLSLTRDDVAGLRYMLSTNNINTETPAPGSLVTTITTNSTSQIQFPANSSLPSGFGTFDLSALTSAARTNDPATLQALFPGVIVATSSNYLTVVATPIVTSKFKYLIGAPAGSAPKQVLVTNGYTYSAQTIYVTTFANVVTNHAKQNPTATLQTITVGPVYGSPLGSPAKTNISTTTVTLTNTTAGDYYTLAPDNCPLNLIKVLYTNVVVTTNIITSVNTNIVTATNTVVFSTTQALVTSYTNYAFLANPVTCTQTAPVAGLYQGVRGVKFVRADFDSLLGQFFQPVTNNYTMTFVTNSQLRVQKFQRVVTQPDFLFSAADLAAGPAAEPAVFSLARNLNFNQANVYPGLAGPGTITPSTTITFDKVGPVYLNVAGGDELTAGQSVLNWGSFDGSTNDPVVYPNGTSLQNLANQVLVQITPASLPVGTVGVSYPATAFQSTGGAFSPPYTWSQAFGGSLPSGLTLSSSGTISGTPTQSGTFDFILQLTDSLSRTVQWNYSITIQ